MYLNFAFDIPIVPIPGLTLTWDVFKCKSHCRNTNDDIRLTLTWDVFKWKDEVNMENKIKININMRCI